MRKIFKTTDQLIDYLNGCKMIGKSLHPWRVIIGGEEFFILAGNADHAIAGVARLFGAKVESVPINQLIKRAI